MSTDRNDTILISNAIIFCVIWYLFVCVSSGTATPLGIFIPCILIGCSLGHIYSHVHYAIGFGLGEANVMKP